MNDYLQPDFYKFNMDSVGLVRRVQKRVQEARSILDLGAGSGFMGIELARTLGRPELLTLVEAQKEYLDCLRANVDHYLKGETRVEIIISTFGEWRPKVSYDLIVCNPPYFLPGRGEPSTNVNRGIARTFMIDDWGILFQRLEESLSPTGQAFFVVRHEKKILETIHRHRPPSFRMGEQVIDNVVYLDLSRLDED